MKNQAPRNFRGFNFRDYIACLVLRPTYVQFLRFLFSRMQTNLRNTRKLIHRENVNVYGMNSLHHCFSFTFLFTMHTGSILTILSSSRCTSWWCLEGEGGRCTHSSSRRLPTAGCLSTAWILTSPSLPSGLSWNTTSNTDQAVYLVHRTVGLDIFVTQNSRYLCSKSDHKNIILQVHV